MRSPRRRWAVLAATTSISTAVLMSTATAAFADDIPNPAADGSMPGAALVAKLLGWLKYGSLAAAIGGLLIGAISVGVGHFGTHGSAASTGRKWLLGGMGAAILAGLSWTIATTLYSSTS